MIEKCIEPLVDTHTERGFWTVTVLDMRSREALALEAERNIPELIRRFTMERYSLKNTVPTVYLTAIALNKVTAPASVPAASALRFTYMAVGTGTTAPAVGNTQLGAEVFRDTVDSESASGATAKITMLLTTAEANGNTLGEIGLFAGNASGAANSGLLGSGLLIVPTIAKTVAKSVVFECSHISANG